MRPGVRGIAGRVADPLGQAEVGDLGGGRPSPIRMLAGFKSRCTMPTEWAAATAQGHRDEKPGSGLRVPGRPVECLQGCRRSRTRTRETPGPRPRPLQTTARCADCESFAVAVISERKRSRPRRARREFAGQDHLECDDAVGRDLTRFENKTHPAAADGFRGFRSRAPRAAERSPESSFPGGRTPCPQQRRTCGCRIDFRRQRSRDVVWHGKAHGVSCRTTSVRPTPSRSTSSWRPTLDY